MKTCSLLVAVTFLASLPAMAEVRIAAVYSTSGPQAPIDAPSWQGVRAVVDQVNRGGGIGGSKVSVTLYPIDSTAKAAANAVKKALEKDPGLSGFVGLSDTDLARAAADVAARSGKVFITSGATSPRLPGQVWGGRTFLACFGDNAQAAVAAEWLMRTRKITTAAVLYNETESYTRLLQGYFTSAFHRHRGRITGRLGYRPGEVCLIPPSILKAEAIYLAAETADEALGMIAVLRGKGFGGPILGGDGYDAPAKWAKNPLAADVYFTTHAFPARTEGSATAADVKAFRAALKKNGQTAGAFAGLGRDAALVLLRAIASSGGRDRMLVRNLRLAPPFPGVTGSISYRRGNVPVKPVALVDATQPDKQMLQMTPLWVPRP